jgi:hypothetical protein
MPSVINSMPIVPVGTVVAFRPGTAPDDIADWLECDGQAIPAQAKYAKLIAIVGPNVPNYDQQFLRGTTDVDLVDTAVPDSIRSHDVQTPGQKAAVTGTASPQSINNAAVLQNAEAGTADGWATLPGGGITNGGTISGVADVVPVTSTYDGTAPRGVDESAPVHTFVRYFIRSVQ